MPQPLRPADDGLITDRSVAGRPSVARGPAASSSAGPDADAPSTARADRRPPDGQGRPTRLYPATMRSSGDAPAPPGPVVDLDVAEEEELARRVSTAWKELRRGSAMVAVRDYFFGADDDALEPGQMDTLDLLVQRPVADERAGRRPARRSVDRHPRRATPGQRRPRRAPALDDDGRVVMVVAHRAGRHRHEPSSAAGGWS